MFTRKEELFRELLTEESITLLEEAKLSGLVGLELKSYADGIVAMGSKMLVDSEAKKFIDKVVAKGAFVEIYKSNTGRKNQNNSLN